MDRLVCKDDRELDPEAVRRALACESDGDVVDLEGTFTVANAHRSDPSRDWHVERTHVHLRMPFREYLRGGILMRGKQRRFSVSLRVEAIRRGEQVFPEMLAEVFRLENATPDRCQGFAYAHCAAMHGRPWDVWAFPVMVSWRLVHHASGRAAPLYYADGARCKAQTFETTLVPFSGYVANYTGLSLVREPMLAYKDQSPPWRGMLVIDETCTDMLPYGAVFDDYVADPRRYGKWAGPEALDRWLVFWLEVKLRAFRRAVEEAGVAGRIGVPADVLDMIEGHYRAGYDDAMFSRHKVDPRLASFAHMDRIPWLGTK